MGPRIAILIADSEIDPFPEIKIAQRSYINFLETIPGVDVFYFSGRNLGKKGLLISNLLERIRYSKAGRILQIMDFFILYRHNIKIPSAVFQGNQIHVDVQEGLRNLGPKLLSSINLLSNSQYDYYFKTTLSSIANMEPILEILSNRDPDSHLYAGPIVRMKKKEFVSGSCLIVSSMTANHLIKNRFRWNHGRLDDVAIGNLLQNTVPITALDSISFSSIGEVAKVPVLKLLSFHHFRCKSNTVPRQDVAILENLLGRLSDSKFLEKDYYL